MKLTTPKKGHFEVSRVYHHDSSEIENMESIKRLADLLIDKGLTIAVAESCTGGLIAKSMTDLAGSSVWFLSGVVSYCNEAKSHFLNVPETLIQQYGAVSSEVALEMAKGIALEGQSDIGISTTGIAGPGGGSIEKPVGLVCFGFSIKGKSLTHKKQFLGNREEIRQQSLNFAVDALIDLLGDE